MVGRNKNFPIDKKIDLIMIKTFFKMFQLPKLLFSNIHWYNIDVYIPCVKIYQPR